MEGTLSLKEQFELPLVQDLIQENQRITSNLSTKLPNSQIEKLKIPHVIKNRLVMQEGEFNGVHYSKEAILKAVPQFENLGLIFDHKDTAGEGASHWAGRIENPHWDTLEQGEGVYADLVIVDKPCAQKLAAGAKWGISPTFNYEKNEVNGSILASDLIVKSCSFVLDPAVRATMLNSNQRGGNMETKDPGTLQAPPVDKKLPYKYPKKLAKKKKKDKEDEEEMSETQVSEEALSLLEERDAKIKELSEKLEKFETAQKQELVTNLTANEFLVGRLEAEEIEARTKTLLEKSPEILTEVQEVVGDHAELQSYRQFVKTFLKKNPGKSIKDAAAAWRKQKPKGKGKLETEPENNKPENTATLQEASLTKPDSTPEGTELSQLQKHHQANEVDAGMIQHLRSMVHGGVK